jgi:glycosyltransferase involved in cell wall biosynthesis
VVGAAVEPRERSVGVVIPVYRGQTALPALVEELAPFFGPSRTPEGRPFRITEVLLTWDRGPDASDRVIRELVRDHPCVEAVWLARNVGQHGATLAGIAASTAEWIVTMDEDGLHDPRDIGRLLDAAFDARRHLVYARPTNAVPHSALRNAASRGTKRLYGRFLARTGPTYFSSFRLVLGELARGVAVLAGPSVYLDVALAWSTAGAVEVPIEARPERRPAANYDFRRLREHFWRLIVSSGGGPLRSIAWVGGAVAAAGLGVAFWVVRQRLLGAQEPQGWTSLMAATLVLGGMVLLAISVVAVYLGTVLSLLLGRPSFTIVTDDEVVFG